LGLDFGGKIKRKIPVPEGVIDIVKLTRSQKPEIT